MQPRHVYDRGLGAAAPLIEEPDLRRRGPNAQATTHA